MATSTPRAQRLDRVHRRRLTASAMAIKPTSLPSTARTTLQFLGFCAKLAEVDFVLRHQQLVDQKYRLAVDLGLRALAFEVLKSG
jgi:hypothetical protein